MKSWRIVEPRKFLELGKRLLPLYACFVVLIAIDKAIVLFGDWGWIGLSAWQLLAICISIISLSGVLLLPALILGRISKIVYVPLILAEALVCLVRGCALLRYGFLLGGEWIDIVLASSKDELRLFVLQESSLLTVCMLILALVGLTAVVRVVWKTVYPSVGVRSFLIAFIIAGCFVISNQWCFRNPQHAMYAIPSVFFVAQTYHHAEMYFGKTGARTNLDVCTEFKSSDAPFIVFVLGESATRNRWGLYGYERDTTPQMNRLQDELVVFSDVMAAVANTPEAMRYLFTDATLRNPYRMGCTLVDVLTAAGYRCVAFSSQARWGTINCMEMHCFQGCSSLRFLAEEERGEWYDDKLLEYLDAEIGLQKTEPEVVFLHLRCGHFPVVNFYPVEKGRFPPESFAAGDDVLGNPQNITNHYDNTIAFTDDILGEVVKRLRFLNRPTMMFYISDHGESVGSNRWRVLSDMNVWQIPMVCWFSSQFRDAFPKTVEEMRCAKDRPLQSDRLLTGIVSMCQVKGYGAAEDDFHGNDYKVQPRLIQGRSKSGND